MYLGTGKVPAIWEDSSTDCVVYERSCVNVAEKLASSEDEDGEELSEEEVEKKNFLDALYAFMEDRGM